MRRAADLAAFARAPRGQFLAGKSWLFFCAHEGLWGVVLHGWPDRAAAEEMSRAFLAELEPSVARHDALVDAQALEGIDSGAFETLQRFARDHLEGSRAKVARLALVLPPGVSGAVVAGFYGALDTHFVSRHVADRRRALGWLDDPRSSTVEEELEAALAELRRTPPLVGALRALLRTHLQSPDEPTLATALRLSTRTLQRRLAQAGTSFQREVQAARVEAAKLRLADSNDAVTLVAVELGFGSSQHFSRQFRLATGQSPSEWRARHRTGGPSAGSS